MPGACPTCGAELPAGGTCPRCLLRLGLAEPIPTMPERLGVYEIVSRLGEGGMGEVYRARDTRLHREVAIKVLPELLVGDPERTARFRREARVAASLNHPNIAAVYGFEEEAGAHFLVMELVEGETLAEHLRAGAMPVRDALALVAQIADGLEAAHESGVVHRDLKPGNIKITPSGQAKILDFGLAKVLDPSPAPAAAVTGQYTSPGTVFGTVPYMSPEQARGRPVDRRADIWSLGCVLYECLSGRRAFDGPTATDVVAKILERDPDWSALPSQVPDRVRELLQRCLEKEPRERVRDAGDVRLELARAQTGPEKLSARPRRTAPLWTVVALALLLPVVWLLPRGRGTASPTESPSAAPMRVVLTDPEIPHVPYQDAPTVAVSPDGRTIAYTAKGSTDRIGLYIRRADEIRARRLEVACDRRKGYQEVSDPFFSPDGASLGYSCGNLYTGSLTGGPATLLAESVIPLKGATWSSKGIIFSPAAKAGLVLVPAQGGPLETLTVPDGAKKEVSHRWPSVLPDGLHVLFTIKKEGITTFDQGEIALLDLSTKKYKTLLQGGSFARYLPTGQIVFAREATLLAVNLDLERGEVRGRPMPVLEGVTTEPSSGAAQYAIARDTGTLVFVPGGVDAVRTELAWIDRGGRLTPIEAPPQQYHSTLVSPDGTHLASTVFGATDGVFVYDLVHRSLSRVTSHGNCSFVAWTPDGKQILYGSDESGRPLLMLGNSDGTGTPRRVGSDDTTEPVAMAGPAGASALVYTRNGGLWRTPLEGDRTPQRVGDDVGPGMPILAVSPDGRWLAYVSDASGRSEIYVRPFPSGSGLWQVSREGGGKQVYWTFQGDEILFRREEGGTQWVCAARIRTGSGGIAADPPRDLFPIPSDVLVWGPHPDGQRFIAVRSVPPAVKADRVEAILGWSREVAARVSGRPAR